MELDDAGEPTGSPDEPEVDMVSPPPEKLWTRPPSRTVPRRCRRSRRSAPPPRRPLTSSHGASGASAETPPGASEPEEKPQSRTGRNLPLAIGVGAGLGALVLVSLYTVKEIFLAVMIVFLFLGMRELTEAFKSRDIRVPFIPVATGMVGTPVVAYVWGPPPRWRRCP